jgi:UDP-N-acetylmuramyl pentapeptide phosphotransferase/UDP-N-acetylglucosamine-1-phosphate transferase
MNVIFPAGIPKRYLASLIAIIFTASINVKAALILIFHGIISFLIMPKLIRICEKFNISASVIERSNHITPTPTCGGMAFLLASTPALVYTLIFHFSIQYAVIITTCFFVAILGALDDFTDIKASYKFFIQFILALFVVHYANVRIASFDGILGIGHLENYQQYILSILVILGITNSLNLLDGLDGLAGSLGFVTCLVIAVILSISGSSFSLICFAFCGGILGFLNFNLAPAKIYMGDLGSLLIGFITSIMAIHTLNLTDFQHGWFSNELILPVICGVFLLPVLDTIRLFIFRLVKKRSPFSPDRHHIHHYLLDYGFSVWEVNRILISTHVFIIFLSLTLPHIFNSITTVVSFLLVITMIIFFVYDAIYTKTSQPFQKWKVFFG